MRDYVVRLDDPNPVIGKLEMHLRQLHLRHMTRHALLRAARTSRSGARRGACFRRSGEMAGQAFRVIE